MCVLEFVFDCLQVSWISSNLCCIGHVIWLNPCDVWFCCDWLISLDWHTNVLFEAIYSCLIKFIKCKIAVLRDSFVDFFWVSFSVNLFRPSCEKLFNFWFRYGFNVSSECFNSQTKNILYELESCWNSFVFKLILEFGIKIEVVVMIHLTCLMDHLHYFAEVCSVLIFERFIHG